MLKLSAPRAFSFAMFAAIAVTAWHRLMDRIVEAASVDADRLTSLAVLVPAVAGVMALMRWAPSERPRLTVVGPLLVMLVSLRVVALASVDAPVVSDWLRHHELAVGIAGGGPRFDVVPTGFPMLLALGYKAVGPEPVIGQVIQIVIATGIGAATYLAAAIAWNHRIAAIALLLVAIAPSQILLGTVLASEPLYTLLLLCAACLLLMRPTISIAFFCGATLGLSQYVRATSFALAPLLGILVWRVHSPVQPLRALTFFVTGLTVVLLPLLVWNLATIDIPSPSSSRVQNFSLMVGMNQASDGRWTTEDYRLVGEEYGTERSERIALQVATKRISEDPLGTIGLLLRKVWAWGDEAYGSFWATAASGTETEATAVLTILSQAWWAVVASLAALAVGVTRLERRLTQLTVGTVAVVTVLHLVLEAQGRYHAYLLPLFAILAAGALGSSWWSRHHGELTGQRAHSATIR